MRLAERAREILNWRFWLTPGMGVKRHVAWAVAGTMILVLGAILAALWFLNDRRARVAAPLETALVSDTWLAIGGWVSLALALSGIVIVASAVVRLNRSLLSHWLERPQRMAEVLHRRVLLGRGPKIVTLGGGSGLSNLLRGLREETSNLTAIVAVSDDGGSSGRLRQAFDMPAPGDLTDCLAALSDHESRLSRLLQYRFTRGGELSGHTFGNLLITTLTEVEGDFGEALRLLNQLLNLSGAVYPATSQPVSLVVTKLSGEVIRGEQGVRQSAGASRSVSIAPADPEAPPEVLVAINEADMVVLGPGSLFTSILPPLLVPAIRAALAATKATVVYIGNIMTEAGETDGFDAFEHVKTLMDHGVRRPEVVLLNSAPIDDRRLERYRQERAELVLPAVERLTRLGVMVVHEPVMAPGDFAQHDSVKVAKLLIQLARGPARRGKLTEVPA